MNKKLLSSLCLCAFMAVSTPVKASCDGLYLAGRAGIINHNMGDQNESFGQRYDLDDNSWALSGAIGYRFKGYFRVEAEYAWRQNAEDEKNYAGLVSKMEFQTYSYMLNLYYDFSPYTMFTPYAMAGIGYTHIEQIFSGGGMDEIKYDANNLTWSLGGGLSAKMTNRWNIDVGYRFFNMGKFNEATIRAHEVYIGTRYVF